VNDQTMTPVKYLRQVLPTYKYQKTGHKGMMKTMLEFLKLHYLE